MIRARDAIVERGADRPALAAANTASHLAAAFVSSRSRPYNEIRGALTSGWDRAAVGFTERGFANDRHRHGEQLHRPVLGRRNRADPGRIYPDPQQIARPSTRTGRRTAIWTRRWRCSSAGRGRRSPSLPGATLEVVRLPGRTPVIFIDMPGQRAPTRVLLYGHLDKQPEMIGWAEGFGPVDPGARRRQALWPRRRGRRLRDVRRAVARSWPCASRACRMRAA